MHKVILADHQAIFRAGTARVLALESDIRIVAQAAEADRLLSAIQSFPGAMTLFSLGLAPDLSAVLSALRDTGGRGILIAERADALPDSAVRELCGLILRSCTAAALVDCVRKVGRGLRLMPVSEITSATSDSVGARVRDRLTPREMQIVALIVQGCKNKEIAFQLGTKEQVIKNYLRSIYDKTGVSDRLELALFTLHHKVLAAEAAKVGSLLERKTA